MSQISVLLVVLASVLGADSPGTIEFAVKDTGTKETVPCRIHLIDSAGKLVKPEGIALPFWRDHFVCDGAAKVQVPTGEYRYEVARRTLRVLSRGVEGGCRKSTEFDFGEG